MKINKLGAIALSILALNSTSVLAAEAGATKSIVNGGKVYFKGEVINAACAVDAGSIDQTVQLGQVRSAKLAKAGDTSPAVGFNIQLNDCDTAVSTKASIAFSGTAVDSTNTTVLATQSSTSGGAKNIGVQILDKTGTPLVLDGSTFSTAMALNDGSTAVPLQARFYATGSATAGTVSADASFKVQYE